MSSPENTSSPEAGSPERDTPVVNPANVIDAARVNRAETNAPPESTPRAPHSDTIAAPPPDPRDVGQGPDEHEDRADHGDHESGRDEAGGPETEAAGDGGAAGPHDRSATPKKRRRRRRKKAGGGGAATDEAAVAGGGESKDDAPNEGAHVAPDGDPPGGATAQKPRPKKNERQERKDRPLDNRFPRERPAFGVGDVVFGKIIEITDDAVFVDLSGKARGIFDRHEMDLPDEPAEEPGASHAEDDDDSDVDADADRHASADGVAGESREAGDSGEAREGATAGEHAEAGAGENGERSDEGGRASGAPLAEGSRPQDGPAVEPDNQAGNAGGAASEDGEPPTEGAAAGEGERRVAGRRIIVAAGAKAIDTTALPKAEEAPGAGDARAADAEGEPDPRAAETAALRTDSLAPDTMNEGRAPAAPPSAAAPRPAPYAPPIVLEVGAHFVGLVHNDGSRGGLIVLTRHPRRVRASKLKASAAFREKSLLSGLVTGVVRGGVEVDLDGLRAFAPGSHLDLRPGADLRPLVGRRLEFLVTQYGKRGRDVVLSRRPMLESEAKAHRAEALERVQVGAVVPGVVKSVVSFGAFLDIGGVEGLVTLQEMSHNRGDAPHDVFRAGETVDVRIIRMDEKGKIWLSRKSAIPDPWDDAMKKYAVGTRHAGKIVRLQPFGAFVELEPGIDGLIHVGDLSVKPVEHPSDVVKVGDPIDVVVAQADPVSHKIGLHPAPTGAAADEAPQRVQLHKPLKVQVTAIEPGGIVVRILGATGRHARGYITAMATGTARGTELRKPFPVGMVLDAKVIEMDPRRGEIKLSIKALHDDTERSAYQQYRQQVTREAKFGTFGDLLAKKDVGK